MIKQTGRSMLEMLMILGIVAILTVATLVIFTISMDKQRANDLADGAQRRALVVSEQINFYGRQPSLKAFTDDALAGGTFGKDVVLMEGQFGIPVFGVRSRICQNLINMIGQGTVLRFLSLPETPEEPISKCEAEVGDYLIVFDNDARGMALNSTGSDEEEPTEPQEVPFVCDSPAILIFNCNGTTSKCCPDNGNSCLQPTNCCVTVSDCTGSGKACIDDECRCPDGWFQNKNGNCTDCSNYASKEPVSEESCLNCINFGYQRKMERQNGKDLCVLVDYTCPEGSVRGYSGTDIICRPCSDPQSFTPISVEDCTNDCPNRELFGNTCALKCQSGLFRGSDKECYQCSDLNKIKPNKEDECDLCSDREMLGDYCVLKECPSGYFQGVEGACISCNANGSFSARTEEECLAKCPDRIFNPLDSDGQVNVCGKCSYGSYYQTDYMTCRPCNSGAAHHVSTAKACAACDDTPWPHHLTSNGRCIIVKCPDGYFKTSGGWCTECSDPYTRDLYEGDAEHCNECNGTAWPRQMINGHCGPAQCKAGQFLKSDGNCAGCGSQDGLTPISANECAKCSTSDNPRQMVNGICMLVNCPSGKFLNSEGKCIDCSNGSGIVSLSADECVKCNTTDNPRKMIYNKCVPEDASCPDGQFINAGHWWGFNCADCSSGGAIMSSAEECAKCDDSGTPRRMLSDGTCVKACSSDKFMTTGGTCVLCSNDSINDATSPEDCLACNNSGSKRKLIDGKCVKDCGPGQFLNSAGACVSCTNTNSTTSYNEAECLSCNVGSTTLREYNNGSCNAACGTGTFRATNGSCYTCTETNPQAATAEECARCNDTEYPRQMIGDKCVLTVCPSGQYFNSNRECSTCSTSSAMTPLNADECYKCNTTQLTYKMLGGKCLPDKCNSDEFYLSNGTCKKCSDPNNYGYVPFDEVECNKCTANGYSREMLINGKCVVKNTCNAGYFSTDGGCKPCSDSTGFGSTEEECYKCDGYTGRFFWIAQDNKPKCSKRTCPAGKFYYISGKDYSCKDCSDPNAIKTTAHECTFCDNTTTPRVMGDDGYCRLKNTN